MPTQTSSSTPSATASGLGRAGLLPFVGGAVLVWVAPAPWRAAAAAAVAAYAAVIVSFLGGIHWGLALRQPSPPQALLAWGVVPSLLAWPALWLPVLPGLLLLAGALWVCYAVDHRVYTAQGVGGWLGLRLQLTLVASVSCLLAAAAVTR